MKRTRNQLLSVTLMALLFAVLISIPVSAKSKTTCWITGISKMADGQMQMYYKGDSIQIKGKARKSASEETVYDAPLKKYSRAFKIADNCSVILQEAENDQTVPYEEWLKNQALENGDEISFISAKIRVKNNKIIKIYFSA